MTLPAMLGQSSLFAGIALTERASLLACLGATTRRYAKNDFVFQAEQAETRVGVVLSGGVHVVQDDFWGYRTILTRVSPGNLFGEAFSLAGLAALPVSVLAAEPSDILLLNIRKLVTTCGSACGFHARLVMNLIRILAEQNVRLTRKMEHLSKRSTREKLLSFLSDLAVTSNNAVFDIPFNRQELADYLCVDRSALSRELAGMRKEGLIRYRKNRFELLGVGTGREAGSSELL